MTNTFRFRFALRTLRIVATALAAWYLHSRGVSAVWILAAAVYGSGLFRIVYSIVCFTVTALLFTAIAGFIIF